MREQFYFLMKKVQENGVQTKQHFKKPYLYTGSWMEGVQTIEELFERVKDIECPSEAMIRYYFLNNH
jgi:hypothetical protein